MGRVGALFLSFSLSCLVAVGQGELYREPVLMESPPPSEYDDFWSWLVRKAWEGYAIPEFPEETVWDPDGDPDGTYLPPMEEPVEEEDPFLADPVPPRPLLTLEELYKACSLKESTAEGGVFQEYLLVTPDGPGTTVRQAFVCRNFAAALLECASRLGVPGRYIGFNCNCEKRIRELNEAAAKAATPEEAKEIRNTARALNGGLVVNGHAQAIFALARSATERDVIDVTLVEPQGKDLFSTKVGAGKRPVVLKSHKLADLVAQAKASSTRSTRIPTPTKKEILAVEGTSAFMCGGWGCEYTAAQAMREWEPILGFVDVQGRITDRWLKNPGSNMWDGKTFNIRRNLGTRSVVSDNAFGDQGVCKYRLRSNGPAFQRNNPDVCKPKAVGEDDDTDPEIEKIKVSR